MKLIDSPMDCPKCGSAQTYKLFEPDEKKSLSSLVGYCTCCGYMMTPVEFEARRRQLIFRYSGRRSEQYINKAGTKSVEKNDSSYYVSKNYSQGCNENSMLFQSIARVFGEKKTADAFNKYGVETCLWHHREFASIFWYKDADCKNLAYRIMQYYENGHSKKGDTITKSLEIPEHDRYCLFGRHLLDLPDSRNKPVCIVESEKTAIICSMAYPQAIWMATGSSYYLYDYKLDFEPDREIILIPDSDVLGDEVKDWYKFSKTKGGKYNIRTSYFINNYVKKNSEDSSFDIADYVLQMYNSQELSSLDEIINTVYEI